MPAGLVEFEEREDAEKAIEQLDGRQHEDGVKICVGWTKDSRCLEDVRVCRVPPEVTREQLKAEFNRNDDVRSVELKEHQKTGVFVAEVRFTQPEHARHAIDAMDGAHFDDTVIRVSWSPKSRPRGFNLNIDLLPEDADRKTLKQRLECFGDIRREEVLYNWYSGESTRCAEVAFATREQAKAAAKAFSGRRWLGAAHNGKWTVDWCDGHVLVVFDLAPGITEGLLREIFSNYGIVSDIHLVQDQVGEFKGHAFLIYDSTDEAQRAIDAMDGAQLGDCGPIRVVRKDTSLPEGFDVRVKNLPPSMDHRALHRRFQEFDGIIRVEVVYDWTTAKQLGVGFVRFATRQQALAALEASGGLEDAHGAMIVHLPDDSELGSEDDSKPVTLTFKSTDGTDHSDDGDA